MSLLQPGDRLGPYLIERWIGQGGMAEVYRGRHETLDRAVAIKILNPVFRADPTFPLRFRREAKTIARLNHPNIIALYDFGEERGIAFLVMELAPGGTLHERARRFETLADAVAALAPVGDALQYAHDRGVVHRDVKPVNILINEREQPVLADFGLARIVDESLDVAADDEALIEGTPHYMAPEQVTGRDDRSAH